VRSLPLESVSRPAIRRRGPFLEEVDLETVPWRLRMTNSLEFTLQRAKKRWQKLDSDYSLAVVSLGWIKGLHMQYFVKECKPVVPYLVAAGKVPGVGCANVENNRLIAGGAGHCRCMTLSNDSAGGAQSSQWWWRPWAHKSIVMQSLSRATQWGLLLSSH